MTETTTTVRWRIVGTQQVRTMDVPSSLTQDLRALHGHVADSADYYGHQVELLDYPTRPSV